MDAALQHIDNWIFDLDNTLYPASCNLHSHMGNRIGMFVAQALNVSADDARHVQKEFFLQYGTTLSGMMAEHKTDPYAYLEFVHDFPLISLQKAPRLAARMAKLPGRKIIFTNADAPYAQRVLAELEMQDSFEQIVDIHAINYLPKPDETAYRTLLQQTGIDPARSIFFEDQARNLAPAKQLGMTTVWVDGNIGFGQPLADDDHIDYRTDNLAAWLDTAIDALQINAVPTTAQCKDEL